MEEVFDFLSAFMIREDLDGSVGFALNFVLEELFTNMVKYNSGNSEGITASPAASGFTS